MNIKLMPVDARARILFNKEDPVYENIKNVKPLEGYEDFGIHGTSGHVVYESVSGEKIIFSAKEYANLLRESGQYKGGKIRLLSCSTGATNDGFAQQLADELQVEVLAPSETLNIRFDGELFISDKDILADLFFSGEPVRETEEWIHFFPR